MSCSAADKGADSAATNSNVPGRAPSEVKKATGTVVGMALTYPDDGEEMVAFTLIYKVKLDDGTEVSAVPPQRPKQSPTSIGTLKSDDKGKKVELESITGDEAKEAMAEWKIVRIFE
jgi:hypothetical protein